MGTWQIERGNLGRHAPPSRPDTMSEPHAPQLESAAAAALLATCARKYLWWKTPEEAAKRPLRVVAQVMDLGDYADVQQLLQAIGEDLFRQAILHAEPGYFSARSWAYWHYRLGLAKPPAVPPLPRRRVA